MVGRPVQKRPFRELQGAHLCINANFLVGTSYSAAREEQGHGWKLAECTLRGRLRIRSRSTRTIIRKKQGDQPELRYDRPSYMKFVGGRWQFFDSALALQNCRPTKGSDNSHFANASSPMRVPRCRARTRARAIPSTSSFSEGDDAPRWVHRQGGLRRNRFSPLLPQRSRRPPKARRPHRWPIGSPATPKRRTRPAGGSTKAATIPGRSRSSRAPPGRPEIRGSSGTPLSANG